MICDRDIYASAKILAEKYGGGAIVYVERQWTRMETAGDDAGLHTWQRIMTAVFDLLRDESGGEVN